MNSSHEPPGKLRQPHHDKILHWEKFQETGFSMTITVGHMFATRLSMLFENVGITTICREYRSTRDAKMKQTTWDNR